MCHTRRAELVRSAVLALSLTAVAASAQITTRKIDIRLDGKPCTTIRGNIFLVRDDEDGTKEWIEGIKQPDGCHWIGRASDSFDAELSHFSLRLGIGRTECHDSTGFEEKPFEWAARLDFKCCNDAPTRRVKVLTDPEMPVSYWREVRVKMPGIARVHALAKPCIEQSLFEQGTGSIEQVQRGGEKIWLYLGTTNPSFPGLSVPNVRSSDLMTPDDVVYRLAIQRVNGAAKSPASLSSNAIEIDVIKTRKLKLNTLRVTVE